VGNHGMIYRYRVVPLDYADGRAIEAPAMPGIQSALDNKVAELEQEVETLGQGMKTASGGESPGESSATETSGGDAEDTTSVSEGDDGSGAVTAVPGDTGDGEVTSSLAGSANDGSSDGGAPGWAASRFGPRLRKIQATLEVITGTIPVFQGKFRNLNLLVAGFTIFNDLTSRSDNARKAFLSFRQARDPQSAKAALAELVIAVQELSKTTKSAFQKGGAAPQSQN
jgi:hypothetical protein